MVADVFGALPRKIARVVRRHAFQWSRMRFWTLVCQRFAHFASLGNQHFASRLPGPAPRKTRADRAIQSRDGDDGLVMGIIMNLKAGKR